MNGYSYQVMPKMEADAVQESTLLAIKGAEKLIDNLRFRLNVFQSDLAIEQNVIRNSKACELFTSMVSLSDEVFSALRYTCNQLNSISAAPPAVEIRNDPEEEKTR